MTVCASKTQKKNFCCDLLKLFFEYHQAEEKLFSSLTFFYVKLFLYTSSRTSVTTTICA